MKDSYGRTIDYMRISVTDRCNLRCAYCIPREGCTLMAHTDILSFEELLRLCGVFARLGVAKFKVTGGEPLVRRGIMPFLRALKEMRGVRQVTLTSNGLLLEEHLPEMACIGIDGLNISLDTLDTAGFYSLTGFDALDRTLVAVDAAAKSGIPVKINCVPIRGVNEAQLVDIAALARDKVRAVRFIELMPMGLASRFAGLAPLEVRALLEKAYGPFAPSTEVLGNGPAKYYGVNGFAGKIGLIGAVSHTFCGECNRVRLTAEGRLKLCLARDVGVNLKEPMRAGADDAALERLILGAVEEKPRMHNFADKSEAHGKMYAIGG